MTSPSSSRLLTAGFLGIASPLPGITLILTDFYAFLFSGPAELQLGVTATTVLAGFVMAVVSLWTPSTGRNTAPPSVRIISILGLSLAILSLIAYLLLVGTLLLFIFLKGGFRFLYQ